MEVQHKHKYLIKKKRAWLGYLSNRKMSLRKFDPAKSGECNLDISRVTKCVFLGSLRLKPTTQLLDSPLLIQELTMKSGVMNNSSRNNCQIEEKEAVSSEDCLLENDSQIKAAQIASDTCNIEEEENESSSNAVVSNIIKNVKQELIQTKVESTTASMENHDEDLLELEEIEEEQEEEEGQEPIYAELKTVEDPLDNGDYNNIPIDSVFTSESDLFECTDNKLTRHVENVMNIKDLNTIEQMLRENEAEIEDISLDVGDLSKNRSATPIERKFVREPTPEIVLSDSDEDAIDQLMYNIVDIKVASQDYDDYYEQPEIKVFPNLTINDYAEEFKSPIKENQLSNLPKEKKMLPKRKKPQCKICSQIFKNYLQLKKHKPLHDGERPYTCPKCNVGHSSLDLLIAHLRIHEGKRPYNCKKCNQDFKTIKALERHQPVHVLKKTTIPKRMFKCDNCGKEFRKLCDLDRHTRVHTGEKPSICNICNRRFQQAHNLNKHLLIHTKEKPFQCDICRKKFGRNDVLNRHLLTHAIEKPNRCNICLKTFIRPSQLFAHKEKIHTSTDTPHEITDFV